MFATKTVHLTCQFDWCWHQREPMWRMWRPFRYDSVRD